MPSAIGAAHAHVHAAKVTQDKPLNPSQQARAADPAAKGADFGALVSGFAKAKHAPPASATQPPSAPAPVDPAPNAEVGNLIDVTA